ncbi:MAG: hypothetical protein GY822_24865 [Deltaproteobacteria bacterium]|nr:hypothetical protein [Deltaproteobacteria bacterium]
MTTPLALDDPFLLALGRRLDVCKQALDDVKAQEKRFASLLQRHRDAAEGWESAFGQAVLAPFDGERLQQLCEHLQDVTLAPKAVAQQIERVKNEAKHQLLMLNADPAADDPHGRVLKVKSEIEDIRNHGAALQEQVHSLEREPTFRKLKAACFGTDIGPGWWTLSHFRMKKKADELVQDFGGLRGISSFSELAHHHSVEVQALATLEEHLRKNEAALVKLQLWITERTEATQRFEEAENIVLREIGARLFEALTSQTPLQKIPIKHKRLAQNQRLFWGQRARLRYLDAAHDHLGVGTRQRLNSLVHDLEVKRANPNMLNREALPNPQQVDADTADLAKDFTFRIRTYGLTILTLDAFSDFASHTPAGAQTWWDIMCPDLDGSYIDEVAMKRAMGAPTRVATAKQAWTRAEENAARKLEEALRMPDAMLSDDEE